MFLLARDRETAVSFGIPRILYPEKSMQLAKTVAMNTLLHLMKAGIDDLPEIYDNSRTLWEEAKTERERIFVLPNLVLWFMVWLLAFFSDLENILLLVPFYLSLLGMSIFVTYDRKKSGGWSAVKRPLWETTLIKRSLLAAVLIIVVIALWFVGTYNENLSWLGWNTVAAINLLFSFIMVPSSPSTPEQIN